MAARRKPKPFAEDLQAIRATAGQLLSLQTCAVPMSWTEWELDFLDDMAGRMTDEPLSANQVGKFEQLKRLSMVCEKVDGLSVALLIASCALQADYLEDDEDREFIRGLRQSGVTVLRRRTMGRLLRCCHELEVIERHQGFLDEMADAA